MFFVEVFELLRGLCLEWGLASEALEHNGAYTPQVCLSTILQGHNHFRSLQVNHR